MIPTYDILFVEDSAAIRERIGGMLPDSKLARFEVDGAGSLAEALERLRDRRYDAVLLDLGLPDSGGPDTVRAIHEAAPDAAIVVLTADDSDETVLEAMKEGAQEYLLKDEISGPLLQRTLRYAVDRERLEQDLRRQADTDPLTGLFSRRRLMDALEESVGRARGGGLPLSLCLCDVDNLKSVNDAFGHRKGDEALATLGGIVRGALEAPAFAGRYGGDELVIAFPGLPPGGAAEVAEEIRSQIRTRDLRSDRGEPVAVTCTFGVAAWEPAFAGASDLINAADGALYAGKAGGRDRVVRR